MVDITCITLQQVQTPKKISITVCGGQGEMLLKTDEHGKEFGKISVNHIDKWQTFSATLQPLCGTYPLYFHWKGKETEFLNFSFE